MIWRQRYSRRLFSITASFLIALILSEGLHTFVSPTLFTSFVETAFADIGNIEAEADGLLSEATATGCAVGGDFECINDGVTQPGVISTATDFLLYSRGQTNTFEMTTLSSVQTVTSVTVWAYYESGATNFNLSVSLTNPAESIQYGGFQNLPNQLTPGWNSVTFSGLSLASTTLDDIKVRTTCVRAGGGNSTCTNYAMYAEVTYDPVINVTVGAAGTQQDVVLGQTNQYVGGSFSVVGSEGTRSITGIVVSEQGTVDAQNDLSNIKLFYDLDETAPYDCVGEIYDGTELQYAITVTGGFTAANGTATFTSTETISPTRTMCVYVVLDVDGTAISGETIELEITNPTTNVEGTDSPVISPATPVLISGTSVIQEPILTLENYHWRNDDGNEGAATSATDAENTAYLNFPKEDTKRLRLTVSNEGGATSSASQFRLEYAEETTSCSLLSTWFDVGDVGGAFDMSDSVNLTDGTDTANISPAIGGVSDPNTNFLSPNGGIKDTSSQTGSLTLKSTDFVELEYSIIATSTLVDGSSYCLRVTDAGNPLPAYTNYPQLSISSDIIVSATGTQAVTVEVPATAAYAGGAFVLVDNTVGAQTLTDITITASGTFAIQSDISDLRLRYDFDNSAPYDCTGESYLNSDTLFGSVVPSLNGSNKVTFTDSISVSPTQGVCLYLEFSAVDTIADGETIDFYIENPNVEIVTLAGAVAPASTVEIPGVTTFGAESVSQTAYHWRNNDGNETGATSATNGTENTALDMAKESPKRLRIGVSNTGVADSIPRQFTLEWAQKVSQCGPGLTWQSVDTVSDEWEMFSTANVTDGANSTNISNGIGGVSDGAGTLLAVNGGLKDLTDTTATVVVPANNFFDLEYSIQATALATEGVTYCFRVTDNGTVLSDYTQYAEATIDRKKDFKIQRGTFTMTGDTQVISAGAEYEAPSSTARAFIRITNTQLTGAGPDTGAGNNNADDVSVHITNPANILSSVTFARTTGAALNTRVSWEIIEYTGDSGGENEMIVRRQEVIQYAAGSVQANGNVTGTVVDDNDIVVFITGQRNLDAGRNSYNIGLSTAEWLTGTNQVRVTRGGSGSISNVSYALVEFTGSNWSIQRVEHTYSLVDTAETEGITLVDRDKSFLHVQKRTSQNNHADFGHEVWISSVGFITFFLDADAANAGNHTSVAWLIENTQSKGETMFVSRSNGTMTSAAGGPVATNYSIGNTVDDINTTSIFVNNRSDEAQRSWPEPILGARIISDTEYELWRSDTSANIAFRTEVVEWPTAARTLEQNYYRLYVNEVGTTTLNDPWPVGPTNLGENAEMTGADEPVALGDVIRIKMTLSVKSASMPAGLDSFKLQFGKRALTCGDVGVWLDVGEIGSTTAAWRGYDNLSLVDDLVLSSDPPNPSELMISVATVAGSYEEENNSLLNPYPAFINDEIEYDWAVQHNGADDKSSYCFRMVLANGDLLEGYNFYPVLQTVGYDPRVTDWRWYDDEVSLTPTTPLAGENISPSNISNQNAVKLRIVLQESSGASAVDTKFALQYSEYSDFSQSVATVTPTSTCTGNSLWCYFDGAGVDNEIIDTAVVSSADACSSGVGAGCGTNNESVSTTTATHDHSALASTEFEFTILHDGARRDTVYYFRLYDLKTSEPVLLADGASTPSLLTEGAQLVFSVSGTAADSVIAGITTDATTTATSIPFGSMTFGSSYEAAQQLEINTNATQGYQVLLSATQQLTNQLGDIIPNVTSSNAVPAGWATACTGSQTGCVGYHTTDSTLFGGSSRFAPIDSYAALSTTAEEILYSSLPATDAHEIVYRIQIGEIQPAGDYETDIVYIAVPVF